MKKKRGMSFDEKREKMLEIFHETLDVYNLKEVEKFCLKAGMRLLTSLPNNKRSIRYPGRRQFHHM